MKKLIFVLIMISLFFLNCELMEDEKNFHLVYSITSLDSNPVDIDVVYKVGDEYIQEQTQTPFVVEQDIELDKNKSEKFYYYLELITISDKNISIVVTSNNEYKSKINNLQESYLPLPVYCRGYIGFGMASTTTSY